MARENYLLHRARLILIELKDEYVRVCASRQNTKTCAEVNNALEDIKRKMIETEQGIECLENRRV